MLKVAVVEADGSIAEARGRMILTSDEKTGVPVLLMREVGGFVEVLSYADDREQFEKALNESLFPAQQRVIAKSVHFQ